MQSISLKKNKNGEDSAFGSNVLSTSSTIMRLPSVTLSSNAVAGHYSDNVVDLPPENSPWDSTYKKLEPLMRSGNVSAAKRLYEDTYRCLKYHMLPVIIASETEGFNVPSEASVAATARYASRLEDLEEDANILPAMCGSTDAATLRQALPEILRKAAELGVQGAATCYVSGSLFPYSRSPEGQALASQYRVAAEKMVKSALINGDWRMLHLLTHASDESSGYQSSWVPSPLGNDPRVVYGLNILELIGASGQEAGDIDPG